MIKELLFSLTCFSLFATACAEEKPSKTVSPQGKKLTRREMGASSETKKPKQPQAQSKEKQPPQKTSKTKQDQSPLIVSNKESTQKSSQSKNKRQNHLAQAEKNSPNEEEEASSCEKAPSSFRVTLGQREAGGIGYRDGYSSLDVFLNFSSFHRVRPFFDLRMHVSNEGHPAANAGFGLRYLPSWMKAVIGGNIFFDFRQANHSTFEQLGTGLEILGTKWDMQVNGYFPIVKTSHLYHINFHKFTGHRALFHYHREIAMRGLDASVGRLIIKSGPYDLTGTLGGYHFVGEDNLRATGGLVKLTANLSRYFTVEVQGSYDNLFEGIIQGAVYLNLPCGKRVKTERKGLPCATEYALANRYVQPVSRFEMIVTHEHIHDSNAQDPRTGDPLNIIFVNNTNPTSGDGTAENPYLILSAAEAASSPGDMIYVFTGNGTSFGLNTGILLQNNQWLQGSGTAFDVLLKTDWGFVNDVVPAQTPANPTISIGIGDAVTLANSNIVNGFNIIGANNSIAGVGITNATITNVNLSGASNTDIGLSAFSGTLVVGNVSSNSVNGLVLLSSTNFTANVSSSIFTNTGTDNIFIDITGSGSGVANIQNSAFLSSTDGVTIQTSNTSTATSTIEGNTFTNISSSALNLISRHMSSNTATVVLNNFAVIGDGILTSAGGTSTGTYYVLNNNVGSYGAVPPLYGMIFFTQDAGVTNLLLAGNASSAVSGGYIIDPSTPASTFFVQSPTLTLSGVQAINSGTLSTVSGAGFGTIIFVPFNPPDL